MKKLRFLMIALVAVLGLSSCEKDNNNHDHSADFVGTWTCLTPNLAEALVINADGSFVSTGLVDGNYWEDIAGKIVVEDGNVTLDFENGNNIKGHFDIIPGVAFSIYNEEGGRFTFNYCKEDLSEKIVGMWVCNDSKIDAQDNMLLQTFNDNGTTVMTGYLPESEDAEYVLNQEGKYKVIGDLVFITILTNNGSNNNISVVKKMIYTPNATAHGDIITFNFHLPMDDNIVVSSESWLRIRQSLELKGKTYDYSAAYVTNAKGIDEDFSITGNTFNMANIKAGDFDMMFRSVLFCVDMNANTITQRFLVNGAKVAFDTPITVDGNKVTLDMSASNPAYRKVDIYMFQDQDNTQLHMYMPTSSFINYFANLEIVTMLTEGKINPTDAAAIEKVYTHMEERVESINVSFVLKARK